MGLWGFYYTRADYDEAVKLPEQIRRLAPQAEDPTLALQWGHNAEAGNRTTLGDPESGLEHAERVVANYDPNKHRSSAFHGLQDFKPTSMSWAALALWLLGYPDRGVQRLDDGIAYARELEHPYTLSFILSYAARIHYLRGDLPAARRVVDEEIQLCTEHGFQMWMTSMRLLEGWMLLEGGVLRQGVALMEESFSMRKTTGTRCFLSEANQMLAEAYAKAGDPERAMAAVEAGLDFVKTTKESFYEAELHRVRAELLASDIAGETTAEACFEKAIAVARAQKAKSFELRATLSLARFWEARGREREARERLTEIYGWFTEGYDTRDLKEARALLDRL